MTAKPHVRIDPNLFIKEFNSLARHKHRYEVFRDFVTVAALSVHNSLRGPRYDDLEAEYLQIAGRYERDELEGFARLLGILIALLDAEPKDILGQLYMSLELGNTNTGQFFTPPEVSELMAQVTYGEELKTLNKPFITLCEPACGAGGMVLAFVKMSYCTDVNRWQRPLTVCSRKSSATRSNAALMKSLTLGDFSPSQHSTSVSRSYTSSE